MLSQKDYEGAEKYWLQQKNSQTEHAFWHNLGTIYKLQGDLPSARYAFEKASYATVFSISTHDELNEVKNLLKTDSRSYDPLHPATWAVTLGPAKLWVFGLIISFFLLILLKREMSRLVKISFIVASLLPPVMIYLFLSASNSFVVIKPLPLYGGASQLFAKGQSVSEGELLIGFPKNEWTMIRSYSGDELWVKNSELKNYAKFLWE